jgi:hypothetical protein
MKEKILKEIKSLKKHYKEGLYTYTEYIELLNELNGTAWSIQKFQLDETIKASEIQELIHKEIEKA